MVLQLKFLIMKKLFLFLPLIIFYSEFSTAQVTLLDYETPGTSIYFQYFGSSLAATLNNSVANPDISGINTSATVGEFIKPTSAQTWAGGYADLSTPVDLTTDTDICVKVWMSQPGNLVLKLEEGDQGVWEQFIPINDVQQWVEICYNTQIANPNAAAGGIYNRVVLFYDLGTNPTSDQTMYFDDIVVKTVAPVSNCSAPEVINHTPATTNCHISWSPIPEASRYDVIYREKGTTQWTRKGALNPYKTLRYLQPNTTYQYRVRSFCGTWDFANATAFREFTTNDIPLDRKNSIDYSTVETLELFPNPARETLNIQIDMEEQSDVQLSIVDMTGRLVTNKIIVAAEGLQTEVLDIADLDNGYYMVVLVSGNNRIVKKFAKVK